MTKETALLVASLGLAGALAAAAVALFNESQRRKDSRHADDLMELRRWTSQVFEHLFALRHETEWITWHALHHPSSVSAKMVDDYEAAVHAAYPKALGAMAVVAAMDHDLFKRLEELADELYVFENRVGMAALSVQNADAMSSLASMNEEARSFYKKLPVELAGAMKAARVGSIG